MRQAGVLAAAGIVALEKMTLRLGEDHRRARRLAGRLRGNPRLSLASEDPPTNMVYARLADGVPQSAPEVAVQLKSLGVLVGVVGDREFRLVTHYWIDDAAVATVEAAFDEALG